MDLLEPDFFTCSRRDVPYISEQGPTSKPALDRHLSQHLPRQPKRQRHIAAPQGRHHPNVLRWLRDHIRILRMAGVDGVPVVGDIEVGSVQEVAQVADHLVVDQSLVKNIRREAIFVRIAEGEFAVGGLRDHDVDAH